MCSDSCRSFSSAIAGYGFDLVWGSGSLWSFLADDQRACKRWVEAFNAAIGNLQPSMHRRDSSLSSPPRNFTTTTILDPVVVTSSKSVANTTTASQFHGVGPVAESKDSTMPLFPLFDHHPLVSVSQSYPPAQSMHSPSSVRTIHNVKNTTQDILSSTSTSSSSLNAISSSAATAFHRNRQEQLRSDIAAAGFKTTAGPSLSQPPPQQPPLAAQTPSLSAARYRDSQSPDRSLPERKIDDSYSEAGAESHAMLYRRFFTVTNAL
jgi:hypothetical protein